MFVVVLVGLRLFGRAREGRNEMKAPSRLYWSRRTRRHAHNTGAGTCKEISRRLCQCSPRITAKKLRQPWSFLPLFFPPAPLPSSRVLVPCCVAAHHQPDTDPQIFNQASFGYKGRAACPVPRVMSVHTTVLAWQYENENR